MKEKIEFDIQSIFSITLYVTYRVVYVISGAIGVKRMIETKVKTKNDESALYASCLGCYILHCPIVGQKPSLDQPLRISSSQTLNDDSFHIPCFPFLPVYYTFL